jgi:hypothetical protein
MVKTSRYTSCIPEWTKLPQYKDQPFKSNGIKDVEMEGIEVAVEQKLVQPEGSKRKRTRADVSIVHGMMCTSLTLKLC